MFPKKCNYHNLALFPIIGVNSETYHDEFNTIYQEKILLFKASLILTMPIIIVLTFFFYFHFHPSFLLTIALLFLFIFTSFLAVAYPIYRFLTTELRQKEQTIKKEIDTHLTELANQDFFSKNARAKRLLNSEFQLIKLQPVKKSDINIINENQKISSQTINYYHLSNLANIVKTKTCFYEQQPLKPIVLATILLLDSEKKFRLQATIPLEFELVNGLVSEQITYLQKDGYIVNPKILIDQYHFREIYVQRIDNHSKGFLQFFPKKRLNH
ncbi:hypothetical protein ACWOAH_01370 [Vagococcus vulneris]|uniref:Uncharacterized protein n=1 Tax=Vagococcus vulneris TaxID=1977869 RepID=A0A430A1W6_9ENTE|nr:hypothetical protein [Vagococcus vulneris]RSU00463.1 hypothetical protein CBF37_00170 [Vagococcus vulneris]